MQMSLVISMRYVSFAMKHVLKFPRMEALDFRVIMHDMLAMIKKEIPPRTIRKYYSGKSYFVVF